MCREVLRDATEPLSAETMVRQIMVSRGMDAEDRQQRSAIILRTLQALHRMAKRDDVTRVGKGVGCCGRRPASRLAPVVAWSHRPLGDHWGMIVSCGGCCHLERS